MITTKQEITNWGNNTKTFPKLFVPNNYKEILKITLLNMIIFYNLAPVAQLDRALG